MQVSLKFKVFNLLKIDNSSSQSVNKSNPKLVLEYNCFYEHKVIKYFELKYNQK